MAKRDHITKEYLHEIFTYKDGNLYWKKRIAKNIHIGDIAGSLATHKYIHISISNTIYKAHRLIFLMHHGYLPNCIDHINGNRSDNNIHNLREATRQQNTFNSRIYKTNKLNIKNVSECSGKKKWMVTLKINGKSTNLGRYEDLELAELVAIMAREKYHGNFANHG